MSQYDYDESGDDLVWTLVRLGLLVVVMLALIGTWTVVSWGWTVVSLVLS